MCSSPMNKACGMFSGLTLRPLGLVTFFSVVKVQVAGNLGFCEEELLVKSMSMKTLLI